MPRTSCLMDSELMALHLGDLPEHELGAIIEHLEGCEQCEQRASQLDNVTDPFLNSLRQRRVDKIAQQENTGDGQNVETAQGRLDDTKKPDQSPQPQNYDWPTHPDYEVLRKLGQGGMGTVYKARQLRLNRNVAIKQVRSPVSLSRFRIEAEAVAQLQHPYIVQVFAVEEQAGRPFLALEYIDGPTLEDVMANQQPSFENSAQIVQLIASAVHYAHKKGIIHRDLKPANILLQNATAESDAEVSDSTQSEFLSSCHPKVTDFGVARLMAAESRQTLDGVVLGTPHYMAPEQAASETHRIGPQTDIYSLGVILYEMLTGQIPFEGADTLDILMKVRTREPKSPRRVRPEIPRDLEAICLKCLEKQPNRRYITAKDLAVDLERYLSRKPVLARPVRTTTRMWRWCRRNSVVSVSMVVVMASLTFALISTYVAYQNNEQALANEKKLRNETRAALDTQTDFFIEDLLARKTTLTESHKKYLRQVLNSYERFAEDSNQTKEAREDVADAWKRVADIQHRLGEVNPSLGSYKKAAEKYEALLADYPNVPELRLKQAYALREYARLLAAADQIVLSFQVGRQSMEIAKKLVVDFPIEAEYLSLLATAHKDMGNLMQQTRKPATEIIDQFQKALKIQDNLIERWPRKMRYRFEQARTLNGFGNQLIASSNYQEAEKKIRRSVDILHSFVITGNRNYKHQLALVGALNSLGVLLGRSLRYDEAETTQSEICSLMKTLAATYPGVVEYRYSLALVLSNLGKTRSNLNLIPKAKLSLTKALEIQKQLVEEFPKISRYRYTLGSILYSLARAELKDKHRKDALKDLDQAQEHFEYALQSNPKHPEYIRGNDLWAEDHADLLLHFGKHIRAAVDAEKLIASQSPGHLQNLVTAMRIYARCALEAEKTIGNPTKQQTLLVKGYEDHAIRLLRVSIPLGFKQSAVLKNHPHFATMRDREDFRRLVNPPPPGPIVAPRPIR